MHTKKIPDKIDIELSKTYFANAAKDKKTRRRWIFLPVFLILVVLILLLVLFFTHKQIIFIFNVKIQPSKKLHPAALPKKHNYVKQKALYDFEENDNGWEIPAWALDKPDHVARSLKKTSDLASKGNGSLKLYAEFSGKNWTAALIEIQQYLDLGIYDTLSADLYLPTGSPKGLKAKLILTVSEDWRFVEMARSISLVPGEWTTVTADISMNSTDWRKTKMDASLKQDVRKIAIRIESERAVYSGNIYIDNVRVSS